MPRKQLEAVRLCDAVEAFIDHLPVGSSDGIKDRKRYTLSILAKQTPRGEHTKTRNLTEAHFKDCLLDLHSGASEGENAARRRQVRGQRLGCGQVTLQGHRTNLRQFVQFLVWKKWVVTDFNPLYEITKVAREEDGDVTELRQYRRIHWEEWPALLDAAVHPRDRLMVSMCLRYAQRGSDAAVWRWEHVDLEKNEIQLFNVKKGRRNNSYPLGEWDRREIDRYLEWFVPRYGRPEPHWPLFCIKWKNPPDLDPANWPIYPNKPMDTRRMRIAVRNVLVAYGWPKDDILGEGCHTLRRSGIEWMDEIGGLDAAQRLADHKSLDQTRHYAGDRVPHAKAAAVLTGKPAPAPTPPPEPVTDTTPEVMAEVVDLFTRRRVA